MSNWDPKKLQDWHHRVIDLLIADPTLTNEQIAMELNGSVTIVMLSLLRRTEMFRLALEERREGISRRIDDNIADRINGKLSRLAEKALDTVTGQIEREHAAQVVGVTDSSLQTCEMVLKSLGYGRPAAPSQPGQATQVIVNVTASDIASAQAKLRASHARASDAEPTRALPSPVALRAS